MKFISKEEYLKQPKEVQDKIKELWNPEQWDIFAYRNRKGNPYMMWRCEDGMILSTRSDVWIDLDDDNIIPLLTMDKMIEMIERITDLYLEIVYDFATGDLELILFKDPKGYDVVLDNNKFKSNDRLTLLWNTLTETIKENL